jgi:hypothetical protein
MHSIENPSISRQALTHIGGMMLAVSAREWLVEYIGLQQKQVNKRTAYFKKFSEILPAAKALLFAQVETRLDVLFQLQLAAKVPLMPAIDDK